AVESASVLQRVALRDRFGECYRFDRAEARPSVDPHADGVLAVWLLVDPTLDAHASAATAARHCGSSVPELGSGRMNRERSGRSYSSGDDGELNSASMNRSRSTRSGAGS